MISSRRRIIIVISSVTVGSLLAAALIARRFGGVKPENMSSLIINFAFSLAIVFGIGIFLSKRKDKDTTE